MSKIILSISEDTKERLKTHARDDERSLSKYLERGLIYLANIPGGYHTQPQLYIPHNTPGGIQTTPQPCQAETEVETGEAVAPTPTQPQPTPPDTPSINSNYIDTIDEYERNMGDPGNEDYQRIKKYFLYTDPNPEAFTNILQLADDNNFIAIARDYDYSIRKALDIPLTHELTRSDWKQIVEYFR